MVWVAARVLQSRYLMAHVKKKKVSDLGPSACFMFHQTNIITLDTLSTVSQA